MIKISNFEFRAPKERDSAPIPDLTKYFKVWLLMAKMNLAEQFSSRINFATIISGKLVRMGFVFVFLIALFSHTKSLAGFSLTQTLLFFMTFNLVDILAQLFLRGIYWIRFLIIEGELDFVLAAPINPLFRIATRATDFWDLTTLIPTFAILGLLITRLETELTLLNLLLYFALVLVGFVIAFAIHVVVASVAVYTQEVDNLIWIYRDLMTMGRFPVDIYAAPVKFILTFIIPVAVMTSFPAKALIGVLSPQFIMLAFLIAGIFLWGSLRIWKFSLKYYTSASS